jgi:hypothetical protein
MTRSTGDEIRMPEASIPTYNPCDEGIAVFINLGPIAAFAGRDLYAHEAARKVFVGKTLRTYQRRRRGAGYPHAPL